jgi:methionyl-tRNA synthetase
MRQNQNWQPFFDIADEPGLDSEQKLDRYAQLAEEHFETARFEEFCNTHLAHLDEVTHEFFGTAIAKDAVNQKVVSLFPAREVDMFTDYFWEKIQDWRRYASSTS